MAGISRLAGRTLDAADIADLIKSGRVASPSESAARRLLSGADAPDPRRMDEIVPDAADLVEQTVVVDPITGTLIPATEASPGGVRGPGGKVYRSGHQNQPAGGTRHTDKIDRETGMYSDDKKTSTELGQDRLTMKKDAREGVPVTIADDGSIQKRNNRVSADSSQYTDVIPDNPAGVAAESILSGNPDTIDSYRQWYAGLDDKQRVLVDQRIGGSPIGDEILGVIQGNNLSPERLAAIRAVDDADVGDLNTPAPGAGQYVAADDMRSGLGDIPEGARGKLSSDEIMDPTRGLPEPNESGRIVGAQGVGSLRKQLGRGRVRDGEYVYAPDINDRQAALDNTSELRSFQDELKRFLDYQGGGRQGSAKNAPRLLDEKGDEFSSGAGAQRRGSRVPDRSTTSGMVQDLWGRMRTDKKYLTPAEVFDTPEEFAQHALRMSEINPSAILSDADAFTALTEAARREFWDNGKQVPASDAPGVGNQANPEQPYIGKPEGEWDRPATVEFGRERAPEKKERSVTETGYTPKDAGAPLQGRPLEALQERNAKDLQTMHERLRKYGYEGELPESAYFDPGDDPAMLRALRRGGYHQNKMDGKWTENMPLQTIGMSGAPANKTRFFAVAPGEPAQQSRFSGGAAKKVGEPAPAEDLSYRQDPEEPAKKLEALLAEKARQDQAAIDDARIDAILRTRKEIDADVRAALGEEPSWKRPSTYTWKGYAATGGPLAAIVGQQAMNGAVEWSDAAAAREVQEQRERGNRMSPEEKARRIAELMQLEVQ